MPINLKTPALVLRRVNFGEADRVLTLLTPDNGQVAAIAHGVRRTKSKLAGGIELFALCELCLVKGDNNTSGMWTVTSSSIKTFYQSILSDYNRLQFGYEALKRANDLSSFIETPELFVDIDGALQMLNIPSVDIRLTKAWLYLHLARLRGGELNLSYDDEGNRLVPDTKYNFSVANRALHQSEQGKYDANIIKLLRVLSRGEASLAARLKVDDDVLADALYLATVAIESC